MIDDDKQNLEKIEAEIRELENQEEQSKEKEKMLSEFILDPCEIYAQQPFHFIKFSDKIIGIGILMHRWADDIIKERVIGKTQKIAPAIITSDKRIIPYNREFERIYKIQIRDIPTYQEDRWGLKDIQRYIKEETPASLNDTFESIVRQYQKYISMSMIWVKIHTLWDMSTYFYPLTKVFPIFELRGLPGTAKNKAMAVSSSIAFNSTQIMTNPSEATLFREMHKTRYFDEAEKIFIVQRDGKIESDSRAEVINSGYRYDGSVPRQEKINGKFQTIWYPTFAPQMIASINGLYGATENRAIVRITTKPSQKDQQKGNIEPEPNNKEFSDIRNMLYLCLMQNWKSFQLMYEQPSNRTILKDREYWLWKPLLVLAELIDPELYLEILEFAEKQQNTKNADYLPQESTGYRILTVCAQIMKAGYERLYIKEIRSELPQNEYTPAEKTISTHLDKIGFRDYRDRDRNGSFFFIPKDVFESIIMSIAPNILIENSEYSSQSSQSSQKEESIDDNLIKYNVTNRDECDENKKKDVTNVTNNDELTNNFDEPNNNKCCKLPLFFKSYSDKICPIEDFVKAYSEERLVTALRNGEVMEVKAGYLQLL